ncbi:hypothetical protein POSPLADRAFT_1059903 [Postia placenta MAD-698-R-SB12]|uniref:Uncharacterized protein n=1 Tax=Postia placenta MAD-698-R-SB12 TaxID=670580 RepID=A0A1X6MR10_9APHY|nr:hypothetical protein POSPLADRAFT_1059903 [Postia placenta MAD-698-R-SB12]OSX58808.1 hypothetical protein POSPLADRAFT_1059903 [Postia placenta MAD-698-R-SB12]
MTASAPAPPSPHEPEPALGLPIPVCDAHTHARLPCSPPAPRNVPSAHAGSLPAYQHLSGFTLQISARNRCIRGAATPASQLSVPPPAPPLIPASFVTSAQIARDAGVPSKMHHRTPVDAHRLAHRGWPPSLDYPARSPRIPCRFSPPVCAQASGAFLSPGLKAAAAAQSHQAGAPPSGVRPLPDLRGAARAPLRTL